ncbi:MAG: Bax inhibitor-1/YccA family protein [Bacteroidetes bacterium]|nr:Bax inhibitor-1/YccA family protein [Bacteroidota bacterium]
MAKRGNLFQSHNPVMNERALQGEVQSKSDGLIMQDKMTVQGAINKSLILFVLLLLTSAFAYMNPSNLFFYGGMFGGLGIVILSVFKREWSPFLAPMYAAVEGLFVGSITAMYASFMDGIIFNAVSLTFALLFLMLFLYKMRIIKVTEKFRSGVIMATGAVFVVYLASWILGMFGVSLPFLHEGGAIGIGISLVIIAIASLNLLLDFDFFEKGEKAGAPAYMEWFAGMGLLITLVWLYVEILRLLSYLSSD